MVHRGGQGTVFFPKKQVRRLYFGSREQREQEGAKREGVRTREQGGIIKKVVLCGRDAAFLLIQILSETKSGVFELPLVLWSVGQSHSVSAIT